MLQLEALEYGGTLAGTMLRIKKEKRIPMTQGEFLQKLSEEEWVTVDKFGSSVKSTEVLWFKIEATGRTMEIAPLVSEHTTEGAPVGPVVIYEMRPIIDMAELTG